MNFNIVLIVVILLVNKNCGNASYFDNTYLSTRQRKFQTKVKSKMPDVQMYLGMGWEPISSNKNRNRKGLPVHNNQKLFLKESFSKRFIKFEETLQQKC
jgi:hypothetical protein